MNNDNYAIILAGGRGERFWPMSNAARPKQLLALTGSRPLLAEAVERLQPLIPPERVIIVTNRELTPAIQEIMPDFPVGNIIGEPCGRDTAPALALGTAIVRARAAKACMVVLTADHIISDLQVFRQTLQDMLEMAGNTDNLITIGIRPLSPSTGFGYLEAGDTVSTGKETEFYSVKRFVEKPDNSTAESYLAAGSFYWNSGMFAWSVSTFENAARQHHPELLKIMDVITPKAGTPEFDTVLEDVYKNIRKISVDYAIMEKSENIIMARGIFRWDDIGSWSALEKHFKTDPEGNITLGCKPVTLDASGNVIVGGDNLIALVGVENMVIVQHNNATLICPKNRDQDVKKIVEQLKRHPDYRGWL